MFRFEELFCVEAPAAAAIKTVGASVAEITRVEVDGTADGVTLGIEETGVTVGKLVGTTVGTNDGEAIGV